METLELNKQSMRKAYTEKLVDLVKKIPNLFVIDADLGSSLKSSKVAQAAPDRYLNIGISEQLMYGIAKGLSNEGFIPVIQTFGCFHQRAYEFIKLLISTENTHAVIVGSHGGLLTGQDGHSAQEILDIANMRIMPNMNVIVPADSLEAKKALEALIKEPHPSYLRLVRPDVPDIHPELKEDGLNNYEHHPFKIGRGEELRKNPHDILTVITCGGQIVYNVCQAAKELEKKGLYVRVINMASVKPIDEELIINSARTTGRILTIEDGVPQGLGGAVKELLLEEPSTYKTYIVSYGVFEFGESGSPENLYKKYGLDVGGIKRKIIKTATKKFI